MLINNFCRKLFLIMLLTAFSTTAIVGCNRQGETERTAAGKSNGGSASVSRSAATSPDNKTNTASPSTDIHEPEKTPTSVNGDGSDNDNKADTGEISDPDSGSNNNNDNNGNGNGNGNNGEEDVPVDGDGGNGNSDDDKNDNDKDDISAFPSFKLINETVIDSEALNFPSGTYGVWPNGNAYQQDAVVTFNNYQYAVYYNYERRLCIARRKLSSADEDAGKWEVIEFKDYTHSTNDTHNTATMGIARGDGTIHISWGHHVTTLNYRVSAVGAATDPDNTVWDAQLFSSIRSDLEPGVTVTRITYPRFIDMPDGGLIMLYRVGGSGNGDEYINVYNAKTHSWKQKGIFISKKGSYEGSNNRNAYLDYPQYDKNSRLHITFMWRETGGAESNHDLMYIYSDDNGDTWKNNAGELVGVTGSLPVNLDANGIIIWKIGTKHGLLNQEASYVDDEGRVHIVTLHAPETNPDYPDTQAANADTSYYHYWRDNDGVWHQNKITSFKRGNRPKLLFDKKGNGYIIFRKGIYFGIAAATEANNWTDWKIIYEDNSKAFNEPVVDFYRWKAEEILSVYVQDTPAEKGEASPLRVLDFK